jgi:Cof subfamily protein (haloacid dehalogenase superfamily)
MTPPSVEVRASRASNPRLVATDLDGTLVPQDGGLSAYTAEVLARLDERGVPVVFVTARPLRWMEPLWPYVGQHGLAVVSNGAIVYDVHAGSVRELTGIDPAAGGELLAAIAEVVPGAAYAVECVDGIRFDPDFVDHYDTPAGYPRGPLTELWDLPAVKLLVQQHDCLTPAEFRQRVASAIGDRATPTWSGDGLVEISATGITKASALLRLCADLGIDAAEVIAFGDMPNDLPMLAWSGTSYAVEGADPAVLDVADHTAPGPDRDGVARVLTGVFGL